MFSNSTLIHFPIQPTLPSTIKTSENEIIIASTTQAVFTTRFNSTLTVSKFTKIFKLNQQLLFYKSKQYP